MHCHSFGPAGTCTARPLARPNSPEITRSRRIALLVLLGASASLEPPPCLSLDGAWACAPAPEPNATARGIDVIVTHCCERLGWIQHLVAEYPRAIASVFIHSKCTGLKRAPPKCGLAGGEDFSGAPVPVVAEAVADPAARSTDECGGYVHHFARRADRAGRGVVGSLALHGAPQAHWNATLVRALLALAARPASAPVLARLFFSVNQRYYEHRKFGGALRTVAGECMRSLVRAGDPARNDSRGAAALYADLPSLATFSNGQFFVGAAAFRRRRAEIWPRAREWLFSETARRECPGSRRECTMLEHLWAAVLCEPCLSPPRHMDLRLPESLRVAPLAINTDPNAQTPSSATGPLWGHETRRPPRWRR